MSIARAAVKGAAASWGGAFAGFGVRFIANVGLARLIAPETYGLFALALVYTELLTIVLAASFSQAVVQSRESSVDRAVATIQLNSALALIMAAVSLGVWPIVVRTDGAIVAKLTLALGCARAAGVVLGTYESLLQREMDFVLLAVLRVTGTVLAAVGALTLAFGGRPFLALLARDVLPLAVTAIAMMGSRHIPWGRVFRVKRDLEQHKYVLALGKSLFVVRALEILYFRFDQFVLSRFLGSADFAAYAQGTYLAGLPHAAVAPATQSVALRILVALSSDPVKFGAAGEFLQVAVVHPLALVAIVMMLAPHGLVALILGPQWGAVGSVLPWLACWVVIVPLSQNTKTMLMALGRWRRLRGASLLQLASMLVCGPPLILLFATKGAAAALSISVFAAMWWMRDGLQGPERPHPRVFRGMWAGAIGVVIWWIASVLGMGIDDELVTCSVGIVVYLLTVLWVDRALLAELVSMGLRRVRAH